MKKKLAALILAVCMLANTNVALAAGLDSGSPWVNSDVAANVSAHQTTSLKDNFAMAVDSEWTLSNDIKAGQSRNSFLASFQDERDSRLKDLLTDSSISYKAEAGSTQALYSLFLDWDARNAAGITPLVPYLQEIEALDSFEDIMDYSVNEEFSFSAVMSCGFNLTDPQDSTKYVAYITSPEMFLDDAGEYATISQATDYTKMNLSVKESGVEHVLMMYGYTQEQADAAFDNCIAFETLFAKYLYTAEEVSLSETLNALNNQRYTAAQLKAAEGNVPLVECLESYTQGAIGDIIFYENIEYLQHLDEIYSQDNVQLMKDYLLCHTAYSAMGLLDQESYYAYKDGENALIGITSRKADEDYALSVVENNLGWELSKLYCDKYVTKQDKDNVLDMTQDIIDEYKVMLSEEDFLTDATKAKAIEKLDMLQLNIMYPDSWDGYMLEDLSLKKAVQDKSYMEAMIAIMEATVQKSVADYKKPIERSVWGMTPITMNAMYNPYQNSINMFPGLIGDVLYNSEMSKEEAYAKLGAVIGHEISHAFDPTGASYDAVGNYKNWWTEEDQVAFDAKRDKLVDYYNNIKIWDGLNANGQLEKGEATADIAGVTVLLRLAKKDADFDYDKFFKSYALLWAENSTPEFETYQATYNEHPLNYLRVNVTVAQFDEFQETYDIKPGDGMYVAPEDRVRIW